MILLIVTGIICVLSGILFLSGEERIRTIDKRLSDVFNKVLLDTDAFFLKNRQGTGICLILLGALFFFIAYWVSVMARISTMKIIIG